MQPYCLSVEAKQFLIWNKFAIVYPSWFRYSSSSPNDFVRITYMYIHSSYSLILYYKTVI